MTHNKTNILPTQFTKERLKHLLQSPCFFLANSTKHPLTLIPHLILFAFLLITPTLHAATVSLTWNANTESDLAGYKIYKRLLPSIDYGSPVFSGLPSNPASPQLTISNLLEGTSYGFIATAFDSSGNESSPSQEKHITIASVVSGAPQGQVSDIPQGQMRVISASSDGANTTNVLDGKSATMWGANSSNPHDIILALGGTYTISEIRYLPYSWTKCTRYEIYVSATNGAWGSAVTAGTWANDQTEKTATFSPTTGAFLRLRFLDNYCYVAELNVSAITADATVTSNSTSVPVVAEVSSTPQGQVSTIPQGQMTVISASSDGANKTNVLDGKSTTMWGANGSNPHDIILALGGTYTISEVRYLPHSWTKCTQYEVYVAATNGAWGSAVAAGTWANDSTEKTASFPPTPGAFLRMRYLDNYCYVAEFNVAAVMPSSGN